MNKFNTWHDDQARTQKNTFKPNWNKETILWIKNQLDKSVSTLDIKYQLVKKYEICLSSAGLWIEITKRIMSDLKNGLLIDEAIEKDREKRNMFRRKK